MWLFERPIAHRGLHNEKFSENSIGAFRNAVEHNYIIETDVHLLKSGEVVAFHDFTLRRMCGKDIKISELTLDDIKGNNYLLPDGSHIPLFTELLEVAEGKVGIMLELKINSKRRFPLEKAVLKLIKGKESWIAVQAFNPLTIIWFRKHAPEFYRGMLSSHQIVHLTRSLLPLAKPNFLSYDVNGLERKLVQNMVKRYNLTLTTWTVNTAEKVNLAYKGHANNIIFETVDLDKVEFNKNKFDPINN